MKIVVTGGRGFIGSSVCAWGAEAGHQMIPFDSSDGYDVREPSQLPVADAVIHLAGVLGTSELFDAPHTAVDVNVHGTLNVLEWCKLHDARYVGITMPPVFPSVYTATKICADRLATAWHLAYNLHVSHVCAFNAYGPGQKHGPKHPQKFMPTFATLAWRNEPLPVWGDGLQTIDMVHVDELGRMLVEAVNFGDDDVFDGGTGVPISVNDIANYVIKCTGSTGGIQYLPMRTGEKPTRVVAQGRGWSRLGWKPALNLRLVEETIASYKTSTHE